MFELGIQNWHFCLPQWNACLSTHSSEERQEGSHNIEKQMECLCSGTRGIKAGVHIPADM